MNADEIAISIKNVSKQFILPHEKKSSLKSMFAGILKPSGKSTKQRALRGISFEIKKGEFFGIVGRNGSGKSTLLKIIAGIYQPTSGELQVNGKLVPFIELGVGFNPELTGRENIYLNGALLGFSTKEIDNIYDDIVQFAELEDFIDQKLKNYSSGMQVRLAFSMATRSQADILLIDEVLAVGDADFQRKCFDFFKQLKKLKKTVVFVSHDMRAVEEYCDRAILINNSKIAFSGSSREVAKEYTKLFNKEDDIKLGENKNRWGSDKLIYNPQVKKKDNIFTVTHAIHPRSDINDIVVGIAIKNAEGTFLFGTNSSIIDSKMPLFTKGRKQLIEWKIPNILNTGSYQVTLAATRVDGEVLDWWEDAIGFSTISSTATHYIVNPNIVVNIKEYK